MLNSRMSSSLYRAAPILLLLLIVYLCWKLASLFWLLVAPAPMTQFEEVRLGSAQTVVPNIQNFALFQAERSDNTQLDERIPLKLQGVMLSSTRQYSSAVILVNQLAERYRIGQMISGTPYQVTDITWNTVYLTHQNGTQTKLVFDSMEAGLNQPPAAVLNTNTDVVTPPVDVAPVIVDANPVNDAIQKLQQDRQQYLANMGVNASQNGYEITAQTPLIFRQRMGLQPGDRIISLNGQSVATGQSESQLLDLARQQGKVRLEVQRGNQTMTIQQDFQ